LLKYQSFLNAKKLRFRSAEALKQALAEIRAGGMLA
jgi:hypothetical protein